MLRILFWNVDKKNLTDLVCSMADAVSADVIVLNENVVASSHTLTALQSRVSRAFHIPSTTSDKRFHCFSRDRNLDLTEVHSGFRTSVRALRVDGKAALLGLVHGVDLRNYDSATRQSSAQLVATEVRFVKQQ